MAGLGEGVPRDVEPAGARQQLVGIGAGLEEIHEALELRGVLRADVGSLTAWAQWCLTPLRPIDFGARPQIVLAKYA